MTQDTHTLGQQLNLLEILFERMPMGIAIFDRDFRVCRFNPTWFSFVDRYSPVSSSQVVPGVNFFDLAPGTEADVLPVFEQVLAGETIHQHSFRLEIEGIVSYWDAVLAPLIEHGSIVGITQVASDVTERQLADMALRRQEEELRKHRDHLEEMVADRTGKLTWINMQLQREIAERKRAEDALQKAHDELELRVEQRTAELVHANESLKEQIAERERAEDTLHETQRMLATLMSNLPGMAYRRRNDRQWTMEFVSEGSLELTGYMPSDLILNRKISYSHLIHPDDHDMVWNIAQAALLAHTPFRFTYRITTAAGEEKWVGEQGRGVFTPEGKLLAIEGFIIDNTERILAYQTLEQHVEERTIEIEQRRRVAEGLRDILTVLNSNRPLEEILDYIVTQAGRLLDTSAVAVYRLQSKEELLSIQAYRGLPAEYADVQIRVGMGATGTAVQKRQPVAVPDTQVDRPHLKDVVAEPHQQAILAQVTNQFRAVLAVPLIVKDEVYGGITVYHRKPRAFSAEEIALAVSFADQAALAIENARLRDQAEQTAAAAERSRLARELHDAVTQTLFSASLIAEVVPRLWERNPEVGRQRLEELRQLTRGALAEMRTLLLELRPATLTEVSLNDLLRQLAEAITSRIRVPLSLHLDDQRPLPPDVQVALYRITQEALNNVAKHAGANHVVVNLRHQPNGIELYISDDGRGFKPEGIPPDSLGLGIMRERAESIGAKLTIESEIGSGTQVAVVWTDA